MTDFSKILLFVDYESLEATKEKFAIYADKVDTFALEANAMAEYLSMSHLPTSF